MPDSPTWVAVTWVPVNFLLAALLAANFCSAALLEPAPLGLGSSPEQGPSAVIFPLVFSAPNVSRLPGRRSFHRRLQKDSQGRPNAQMRLYDDLLTNGYYTTRLWIGTPPQGFSLIVDSGSTVTYVPCSGCDQCGNHLDPRFRPDLSTTYRPVKCNVDCTCDESNLQCTYERHYAEMSSSSGVLGEDVISFGKESALPPQRSVFGCENTETGDLFSQHADGIMGLGRGELSIMDQLVGKGVITDSFSLCYGGMDIGGGAMVLGQFIPPDNMAFSRSDPNRSPYYNIELKEIHVAGKTLPLNPRVFDGKYGTVLDSGTTYAYLPQPAFVAFRDAIVKKLGSLKQIRGPDPKYNDICFSGAGSDASQLRKNFPEVNMVFTNGQKLSLSPENYLFRHSKVHGAYCLGVFQNGKDATTLLGGIIVRNTLVSYDRQNQRIGFWKTNCSELWDRMHAPGAPSSAPLTPGKNVTISLSPAEPPSAVLGNIFPGEFQVGIIIFDMSLSLKYHDFVSHVTKLQKYIAHDLEVNSNQVQLLNFTSEGNGTLTRWAIYPAGSSNYISNTTAEKIILCLTRHNVRLPVDFGSYKIIEWKVEPPRSRSWWQEHLRTVVVTALVVVVLASSTFVVVVFIWRRRQQVLGYTSVDEAIREQELQPLQ